MRFCTQGTPGTCFRRLQGVGVFFPAGQSRRRDQCTGTGPFKLVASCVRMNRHSHVTRRSAPPPPPQGSNQVVAFLFVVARMFAPSVGAMMNGAHAFATTHGTA